MKNSIFFYCMIAVFALFLSSCETPDDSDLLETTEIDSDVMQLMGGPQLLPPDLVVTSVTSSLSSTNVCPGPTSGDATCNGGGSVTFLVKGLIKNDSPVDITTPFEVDFCVVSQLPNCDRITINGLAANTSISETVSYTIPCASGPPPYQLIQEVFYVVADVTNVVAETNEANNSRRYFVCRNM